MACRMPALWMKQTCRASLMLFAFATIAVSWGSQAHGQDVHFGEEAFDKVTFSQMTQLEARQKCEEALQQTVQQTQATADLTPGQRAKLVTAGQLDIHRFFARYEQAKREIEFGNVPRDRWQQRSSEAHRSVRPLSRQFLQGLHGDSSLYDKTLKTLLSPEAVSQVKQSAHAFAQATYAEQIDSAMLVVGRQVNLTPEKRAAIREKLLNETAPPAMFGTSLMPLYFVLANMGDVEDDLRDLFNDADWRTLVKLIEAGRTATR